MKPDLGVTIRLATVVAGASAQWGSAQLLHDDFSASAINPALWQPSTPFGDFSITQSGGNAVFVNRGRLLSATGFSGPIEILGRFRFTGNSHDSFKILTRTDGLTTNPWGEFDRGIVLRFQIQYDTGDTSGNIALGRNGWPGASPVLATATLPLSLNTYYDFRFTDDGVNIAVYVSDLTTPLFTASDSTILGNRIGLYNREGAGGGSSISAGSRVELDDISVIPEPSAGALLALGIACWRLVWTQSKKRERSKQRRRRIRVRADASKWGRQAGVRGKRGPNRH